jgi:hypothetical protein
MVLCVDERTQIQALDRTQPMLPVGLGYVEGMTHDYVRHGTTTLVAALDIASGRVVTRCAPRHRHQEFLRFLNEIDASVPKKLDVHLVIDNYSTHKHQNMRRWLAARPRFHVHYTPTYGSWLNQVEIWFNLITQQAIRRGTSIAWKISCARSISSSLSTTPDPGPSSGPRPPTRYSGGSKDRVKLLWGHDTSVWSRRTGLSRRLHPGWRPRRTRRADLDARG